MNNNHFDDAYVKYFDCFVDVHKLIQIRKSNELLFNNEYKEKMFCPECQNAILELVYGQKKYLRTLKGKTHDECCQYTPEINLATKKQIKVYEKNVNPQIKENNLLSLLYRLNNHQIGTPSITTESFQKPDFTYKIITGKTTSRVVIPQQKIRSDRENKFLYDRAKYYYGIVWLETEKKSFEYNEILLKIHSLSKEGKGHHICSLLISKKGNLSSLTDELIKNPLEGKYAIAFFGQMELDKKYNRFKNLHINDRHDVKWEAVTS